METIVSIDVETTGLDPERDAIIEIGAVRFKGTRIEAEWTSLVNPRRHVPEFITTLTGIDDAMLRQAKQLHEVAGELEEFVGGAALLGHNIRFDVGFLQRGTSLGRNRTIDSYELASVLLPKASRYNLGSLAKELGVLLPATHRALDDARATHAVYMRLHERARQLPIELVQKIVRLSEPLAWSGATVFQEVLRARAGEVGSVAKESPGPTLIPKELEAVPEAPEAPIPLDPAELTEILEYGGAFSRHFSSYEHRPEQIEMLRAVADAFSHGKHLLVEAGTGIGKSFAYLIPAALFALQNNTRVVISTNTINLQDQLTGKDIPDLKSALGLDLRASVLKGRSNYVCPRKVESAIRFGPRGEIELRVLAKILVWQLGDTSGDRSNITLNGNAERDAWLRLSADDEGCTTETCLKRTGGACPFHQAKTSAQSSHLLVVNHALLLSNVAAEGRVLPDYSYLVIDEGHHLESATTGSLSFRFTQQDLERQLKDIGGTSAGLLGRILPVARRALDPGGFGLIERTVSKATDLLFRAGELSKEFFALLGEFAGSLREGDLSSPYPWQLRLQAASRSVPGWDGIEISWDGTAETLRLLLSTLSVVSQSALATGQNGFDELADLVSDLGTMCRRLTDAEQQVSAMISKPVADMVYWLEARPTGNGLSLNAAPLRVGPLIEKVLWHEKSSIVLTSATLTTNGDFQYLRTTLGADEADEIQLGSPFDYENSTLLYLADDIAEPNTSEYPQALHKALIATARAAGGKTLVLFTSYASLRKAGQAITGPLSRHNIQVLEHGEGTSPNVLLESFRSSERAVLLGTRSFWEGIDIPGDALSVLVIPKIPFDVPTDPLVAARAETYEDPFGEFYVPEAILKFRQGFGRLIRTASDRGVVAILDRRILTKRYGRSFIDSLPRCTLKQGPAANLATETAKWLRT